MTIDRHLTPEDLAASLRTDVRTGLSATPKTLPPKYFYDGRGSELFEDITRLPEYYQTRAEATILAERADEVADVTKARSLVELGSGSSEKTHLLLRALRRFGSLESYVPVDVSADAIEWAMPGLVAEYPGLEVHGVVADFERHLHLLPTDGPRLVAFLGGTIGNFEPEHRAAFLASVGETLQPGDQLRHPGFQQGALGPGLVVLRQPGDRLEQLRAALVIEELGRELLLGERQPLGNLRQHAGVGPLGLRPRGGLAVSRRARLNHRARTGSR